MSLCVSAVGFAFFTHCMNRSDCVIAGCVCKFPLTAVACRATLLWGRCGVMELIRRCLRAHLEQCEAGRKIVENFEGNDGLVARDGLHSYVASGRRVETTCSGHVVCEHVVACLLLHVQPQDQGGHVEGMPAAFAHPCIFI